jgi:hypothetical protein
MARYKDKSAFRIDWTAAGCRLIENPFPDLLDLTSSAYRLPAWESAIDFAAQATLIYVCRTKSNF